jgi:hypothetical protein
MTVMLSFWRNDAARHLRARIDHLLSKQGDIRWLWVVGDSSDETEQILREYGRATVMGCYTGICGEGVCLRRRRGAATATMAFAALRAFPDAGQLLLHESDLQTEPDVLGQLERSIDGQTVVAGWPTMVLDGRELFYDIFAFRDRAGTPFSQLERRGSAVRRVSSIGSVWLAPAALVVGRSLGVDCVVDLCRQWSAEGVRMFVDPRVSVIQPTDLWEPA